MPPVKMVPFALAVLTANRQCKCPFVLAVVITNRQYKWWRWILPTASRSIFPLAVGNEDRQCSPCYKYASSSSRQFIVPRSSHESTVLGGHFFQETRGEVLILISLEEEALEGQQVPLMPFFSDSMVVSQIEATLQIQGLYGRGLGFILVRESFSNFFQKIV